MWDLTRSGKQKWTLLGSSTEGQNHTRIVFNMSSVHLQDGRELLISTSMDREVSLSIRACWQFSKYKVSWKPGVPLSGTGQSVCYLCCGAFMDSTYCG